jgi:hypothetical protein
MCVEVGGGMGGVVGGVILDRYRGWFILLTFRARLEFLST